ncbi:MAG: TRAP transporter small permease [Aestuariivirgaceae bacterium]
MGLWITLDAALNRVYRLCGVIAAFLLVTLTVLVLLSIVTRIIGTYIGGLTEFAGYTMAACSFFAMSYTFRSGGHIRVQLLVSHLTGKARRADDLWCAAVFALIVSYLAYYLCELAYESWQFGEISEGGDAIPLWIPQLPTAIGSAVFAISAIHTLIETLIRPQTLDEIDKGAAMGTDR